MSGGNLNSDKCFYYFIEPEYNYKTNNITYTSSYKTPGTILYRDHITHDVKPIKREESYTARRMLGVMLAPNGNCKTQIETCMEKARIFVGKMRHCKLTSQAKRTALKSVLEPGILYPLLAALCPKRN